MLGIENIPSGQKYHYTKEWMESIDESPSTSK